MSRDTGTAPTTRERRSPTTGLVATLFQLSGRSELSGTALVELLGGFGLSPAAARKHLARMREDGQLAGTRSGRGTSYRMIGPFGRRVVQLGQEVGAAPPAWEGHFHALLFAVPENLRAYRDRLRRVALMTGYGMLQPGVLISVGDRTAQLAEVLADCPDTARVTPARIAMDRAEAARVAVPAWDLDDVARTLRAHAETLEAAVRRDAAPGPHPSTLRQVAELFNAVFLDLIRDPRLPAELRPADWPYQRLLVAMGGLRDHFGPPAVEYLHKRLAELDAESA